MSQKLVSNFVGLWGRKVSEAIPVSWVRDFLTFPYEPNVSHGQLSYSGYLAHAQFLDEGEDLRTKVFLVSK